MLAKRYNAQEIEPNLIEQWLADGIYHFDPHGTSAAYSIDTPPATVSGNLHLGHAYSYSHPDFIARFWRMNGYRVFYPMGFDDNGLPTERLVERMLGVRAPEIGRSMFIEKCLEISSQSEKDYENLWKRLGLSIDWRYTYRTIDTLSRRTAQRSFIDLHRKDLVYRKEAPAIWCPECQTAIAQADLNDLERQSEFLTLAFHLVDSAQVDQTIQIATTRPELLPACVSVFVHPEDERFKHLVGKTCIVPLFNQEVPILADHAADPGKGTGIVMCCTFGDTADVAWWNKYQLPLIEAIDHEGKMTRICRDYKGLTVSEARKAIKVALREGGHLFGEQLSSQSVRVHERCDTPVEYIIAKQWFIRILDRKDELLEAGDKVRWYPEHMRARYRAWVENLNWDWCISRQRYYGVPFPVWFCHECGKVILADNKQLPVDPLVDNPAQLCECGSDSFLPDTDIMDTWATSSMTPQIVGRWLDTPAEGDPRDSLYANVFPFSLRPQSHEIIRTWAFYTIVKSIYHFAEIPWSDVLISGWGIAGEGMEKISKSRAGGATPPLEMIECYSADAVRYWAASTGPGKDARISEEKIQLGAKLVTKLWNVARFCERFLIDYDCLKAEPALADFTPADRWILSINQGLIRRVTEYFIRYDYAVAKSELESFFWRDLADNYLEMCKQRLYEDRDPTRNAAIYTLHHVLLTILKLFAPIMPFVTDTIYQELYPEEESRKGDPVVSIHTSEWPQSNPRLESESAERIGLLLVDIATRVRRFKSEKNLSLAAPLERLQLVTDNSTLARSLSDAAADLKSVTRTDHIDLVITPTAGLDLYKIDEDVQIALEL